jgi:hypothetical protein
MTVTQALAAMDAGVMRHSITEGGFVLSLRTCTDCPSVLPFTKLDGSTDTFPRCSRCAL